MNNNLVIEYCANCDYENCFEWNVKAQGYKAYCNNCGKRLMLCDECTQDFIEQGKKTGYCDWSEENGCIRYPEKKRD